MISKDEIILQKFGFSKEQKTILGQIKKFNLAKFFMGKGASDGAVGLITPHQTIMTDNFIRWSSDHSYGSHEDSLEYIYSVIFNKNTYNTGKTLFQQMLNDNIIIIQFCYGSPSAIWIPETINDYHKTELIKLSELIKAIYRLNPKFFDKHPMEFLVGNVYNSVKCVNSLDSYIYGSMMDKDNERIIKH